MSRVETENYVMRASGILLPVSSLPSNYGIGCFSKDALEFIDFLRGAGQKYWQILPLGPTGYGDSPYQSFSTFAGNPYFVDFDSLIREGLLTKEECDAYDFGDDPMYVDYGALYNHRYKVLKKAFARFEEDEEYEAFIKEESFWLDDYCLYTAIKKEQGEICWDQWPESLRKREEKAIKEAKIRLKEEIRFYMFIQYQFTKQWKVIHAYADENDIKIVGDIPIYVSFDSADAWASPELFQFTKDGRPKAVAGCPPDVFSEDGQLWGNPLYDWKYHKKTGYEWWIKRIAHCFKLYDVVRVDHFRGFDEYYAIPYGSKSAKIGKWEKGPGMNLFKAIKRELGDVNIIAEDLGIITDSVRELLKKTGYPGMKIIQFAFDNDRKNLYLPYNLDKNCIIYTGTHDNETIMGWYENLDEKTRKYTRQYLNNWSSHGGAVAWDFIRMAHASTADTCIIPLQDYLCFGNDTRINTPATLGDNFKWRLKRNQLSPQLMNDIKMMVDVYGRYNPDPTKLKPEAEEEEAEAENSGDAVVKKTVFKKLVEKE